MKCTFNHADGNVLTIILRSKKNIRNISVHDGKTINVFIYHWGIINKIKKLINKNKFNNEIKSKLLDDNIC